MIVPEYWAEARIQRRTPERQVTVKRFGWSDESQEAAQRHAEERAAEAMARIESGEDLRRIDRKMVYGGADGLPIREEVIARHGEEVITRNAYGALCLNTPNVLFADVDFATGPGFKSGFIGCFAYLAAVSAVGFYWRSLGGFLLAATLCTLLIPLVSLGVFKAYDVFTGGGVRRARRRISRFVEAHPDWLLRVYRTPAGFRVLAMHSVFEPREEPAQVFLKALDSDPVYVRMCKNQNCFRARVSPKPWRVGISAHMRPRPGVWPIKPERMPEREAWVSAYESAAKDYASCRFEEELGGGSPDPRVEDVRRIHDQYSRAESGLQIA